MIDIDENRRRSRVYYHTVVKVKKLIERQEQDKAELRLFLKQQDLLRQVKEEAEKARNL